MAFIRCGDPRKEQCHENIDQLRGKSKGPGKRGHIVADTNVSPFARARNI